MQNGHDKLKIPKGIPHTKTQLVLMEFEWKEFTGFTTLNILKEIQMDLARKNTEPENFKDRIIFMSVFNDIEWKKNDESCISNAKNVKNYSKRFLPGHWTFLCPGSEKKWYGSSYDGQCDRTATKWYSNSKKLVILFSQPPVL